MLAIAKISGIVPSGPDMTASTSNTENLDLSVSSALTAGESSEGEFLPWPLVYQLPRIPPSILAVLVNAKSSVDLDISTQRLVVRLRYDNMVQYTM